MLLREHPLVQEGTYPPAPAHTSFRCLGLGGNYGDRGLWKEAKGSEESSPTWNAAWDGPQPRPFPLPQPPCLETLSWQEKG